MKKAFSVFSLIVLFMGASALATDYKVDSAHSSVLFRANRGGVVNVYGMFHGLEGSISFDSANPTGGAVNFSIKSEAVDSGNERRDNHLRSPDFFNAKQYPEITFKSTGVKKIADKKYEVTGELNLHGATGTIVAEVEVTGSGKDRRSGNPTIGFETTFFVKRSEYGMNFMVGPLSDEIQMRIAVHAVGE